jgi:hypothetical protein
MESEKQRLFNFLVPDSVYAAIMAEADRRRISASRLVRLALADYFEAEAQEIVAPQREAANA